MKLEDVDIEVINRRISEYFANNNTQYQGFVIDEKEKDQLFFDNQKSNIEVFIMPLNESGESEVLVKDQETGFIFDVLPADRKEIQDALDKSEDQKTFEKRVEKIIVSHYQKNIDAAIEDVEARRNELKEKEKKFYVVTVQTSGEGTSEPYVEIISDEDKKDFNIIDGPHQTKEDAEKALDDFAKKVRASQKINNPEYKYYIVSKDRILSGWEFKEDARRALTELPPVKRSESRIIAKRDLGNIDPDLDSNWGDTGINESEIMDRARKNFEFQAEKKFARFINHESIQKAIKEADPKQILQTYINSIMGSMSEARTSGLNSLFNDLNTELNHAIQLSASMNQQSIPKEQGGL